MEMEGTGTPFTFPFAFILLSIFCFSAESQISFVILYLIGVAVFVVYTERYFGSCKRQVLSLIERAMTTRDRYLL